MSYAAPHRRAEAELVRERLLDAARDELLHRPWADISMLEVAKRAHVGRTRLYQEFGSRADFERALVSREAGALLTRIERALEESKEHPREALAAAYDVCAAAVADRSPAVELLRGEIYSGGRNMTGGESLLMTANRAITTALQDTWPTIEPVDAELVGEALLRLASSEQMSDGRRTLTGVGVAEVLGPYLNEALVRGRRGVRKPALRSVPPRSA